MMIVCFDVLLRWTCAIPSFPFCCCANMHPIDQAPTRSEKKGFHMAVCGVCCCEIDEGEALVRCSGDAAHAFHAADCFPQYLRSASEDRDAHDYYEKQAAIRCPSHFEGCAGHVTVESVAGGGVGALKAFLSCSQSVACTVERRATVARVERDAMKATAEANAGLSLC